ncbi:MAG: IS200/IS605 family transposase [Coleofasciculaceae cyanobacterium RL_1_1]|nr:IS200/IS605 family transposase [Coleofasciculaceae cyanobacterium RL_1_1]
MAGNPFCCLFSGASRFRKERHSVSDLQIHLVCVTKYREKVFTSKSLALIETSFREVAAKMDFQVKEFNGEADHVHCLIEYPPKLSISQIVNAIKGISSRRYGQAGHPKPYGKDALWSPSYFVSSVGGAPLSCLNAILESKKSRPRRSGFLPNFLIKRLI